MKTAILPSAQTTAQLKALRQLAESGKVELAEPCDCGGMVRHNNGGNYHQKLLVRMDGGKCWMAWDSSSEYAPAPGWKEVPFGEAIDKIAECAADGWE
jgi:hypothetical protein